MNQNYSLAESGLDLQGKVSDYARFDEVLRNDRICNGIADTNTVLGCTRLMVYKIANMKVVGVIYLINSIRWAIRFLAEVGQIHFIF